MRVMIVSKFLHHVGGVETYIDWLCQKLPHAGVEIAVFGMSVPGGEKPMDSLPVSRFEAPERSYHGGGFRLIRSAATSVYSVAAGADFKHALLEFRPDIVHFHSTCYQLSSSLARVVKEMRIPSVTTAHEYKFVCANQTLWNDRLGLACSDCVSRPLLSRMSSIVRNRCVKSSVGASVLAALESPVADWNWARSETLVLAPSNFLKKLVEDSAAIRRDPIYLDLPWGEERQVPERSNSLVAAYTGRLAPEKGVGTLLKAWRDVIGIFPDAKLQIWGSGSEEQELKNLAKSLGAPGVQFYGRYRSEDLPSMFSQFTVTVHPSEWAENSPYTVRESLQFGVPAIVSDMGGLPEMVSEETGSVFQSGSVPDLVRALCAEFGSMRAGKDAIRQAVRERSVSDGDHLSELLEIYRREAKSRLA